MRKIYYYIIALLPFFQACKEDTKAPENPTSKIEAVRKLIGERPDLNISFLLDLSDRINPDKFPDAAMEFYERDLGYINAVANSFEIHLRNKRTLKINDKIQLYIDPEPADKELNEKLDSLKLTFSRENATKEKIVSISEKYDSIPRLIYESAITDDAYIGSDIWRFFKSKVTDFCILEDHRNILVILTDGYIYHKNTLLKEDNLTSYLTPQTIRQNVLNSSKWMEKIEEKNYGFIPANKNLNNLEVLVLGINPDIKNPYEEDVIYKYWSDWFDEMGVKNYEIKNALIPSNMEKIIEGFILQE